MASTRAPITKKKTEGIKEQRNVGHHDTSSYAAVVAAEHLDQVEDQFDNIFISFHRCVLSHWLEL